MWRACRAPLVAAVLLADMVGGGGAGGASAAPGTPITLERAGPAYPLALRARTGGEGLLEVSAQAPGADWATRGAESAVVSVAVDGQLATDIVVLSARDITSRVQLGYVHAGIHTLTLAFDPDASAAATRTVTLRVLSASVSPSPEAATPVSPATPVSGALALAHAPVLYGRSLPAGGGRFQNSHTDTPLLAWHTRTTVPAGTVPAGAVPVEPGHTVLEYSVMWSNEDGGNGADAASQQALWGRLTDIEWVYRVEVDASGSTVPGSAFYQGPGHVALPFRGRFEHGHPLLQTCTTNNMVCDVVVDAGMRFLLAADREPAPGQARERMMDAFPWTYQVCAAEVRREGKIEPVASPDTPALSDPRNYLYIVIRKTTTGLAGPGLGWVGAAVGVRLRENPGVLYRSDHFITGWSLRRDGAVATAVELPAGTRLADVAAIEVARVRTGVLDLGSTITVTGVDRAFMLGVDMMPAGGSLTWSGTVTLTASRPNGVLLRR
ncbi:hypothetical protein [Frankia sp. Cj3]|uniref:hypothetical protein n=1 Tax=Frankia sp. Cj3 TaxID=2880976 RepID=UPI001EF4B999|nr:hypothetical protein [Frankia sp. Cj3]